jgi:hypothetical protein
VRVSDRQIREVIDALCAEHGRASGAAVRAELERLYQARGGVQRIYRLLAESRGLNRDSDAARLAARIVELEGALTEALRRAELAEHRERVHQDWAATQIDSLRTRLRDAELSPRVKGVPHDEYLQLHRTLAATRLRLAELEAQQAGRASADVSLVGSRVR